MLWQGVQEEAARLGYQIIFEHIDALQERVTRTWYAKGVTGILFGPFEEKADLSELDLRRFALVSASYTVTAPRMHQVVSNYFFAMKRVMRELLERGYRRPVLALQRPQKNRIDEVFSAAFVHALEEFNDPSPKPYMFVNRNDVKLFHDWLIEQRPDVIITNNEYLSVPLAQLKVELGFDWVSLGIRERTQPIAGILQDPVGWGHTAMDFLHGLVLKGEYGLPETPYGLLRPYEWQEGNTIRSRPD